MRKRFALFPVILLLFSAGVPAHATSPLPAAPEYGTALLTIRFNQRNLYLDKAVANAVGQAKAAKPDVVFDVQLNPALQGSDQESLRKVVNALRAAGAADAQIRGSIGQGSGEPYDIVRVFVQ